MPKRTYVFEPVGLDLFDPSEYGPARGARVVKCQPAGIGCPKSGNVGRHWAYVEDAYTGRFYGMVLRASLTSAGQGVKNA